MVGFRMFTEMFRSRDDVGLGARLNPAGINNT